MKKSLLFLIAGAMVLTTSLSGATLQDHLNLFQKAVAEKNLSSAEKHANDAILLLHTLKPQSLVPGRCDILLRPYLNAKDFKTADKLYTSMICNTAGDPQAILLDRYAKFLEKEKVAKPEVIAKLKADRYKVKDLSSSLKFEFLVGDNELEEAAKLADTMPQDAKTLNNLISIFRKKGVFGSPYALKFYKKLLEQTTVADEKVLAIQGYTAFCLEFAFMTDEEAEVLLATRSTLPGLTDAGRWSIKQYDFANAPDLAAKIKIMQEMAAMCKTSDQFAKLNNIIWQMPPSQEFFEVYEKTILPNLEPHALLRPAENYVRSSRNANRYKEAIKFLSDLAVAKKTPRHYCALAAAYDAFSRRYYAPNDPILLERAMLAYQTAYELLPVGDYNMRMELLLRLTDLASRRNNPTEVESFAAMGMNMEIPATFRNRTNCENAKAFLFAVPRAKAAYAANDFKAVVDILKPVLGKRAHFPGGTSPDNGTAYEIFVRSLVALGEYKEALKYADDMVRTAPHYMRKRLTIQVDELRQRVAEKKD